MGQFHEVRFPTNISEGSASGPGYKTNIIEQANAVDERVPRQSLPRWQFNVAYGIKRIADLALVHRFYIARRGVLIGFRFKDFLDYHSSPTNPSYIGSIGVRDQLIGTGTGALTTFQLVKRYTDGTGAAIVRTIRKPVAATVLCWVNGVQKTEGVDYTVDTTTGIVTFASAPANGHAVEASFEFDVPVRFGRDTDEQFQARVEGYDNGSFEDIPLVEDMDPDVGYIGDLFYGGSVQNVSSAIDLTVSPGLGRLWPIIMTATGKFVHLPDPASLTDGQRLITLFNAGSNAFGIKDFGGTTLIASFTAGQMIDGHIFIDGTSAKKWLLA